jgi:hypothetical protein
MAEQGLSIIFEIKIVQRVKFIEILLRTRDQNLYRKNNGEVHDRPGRTCR